MKNHNHIRRIVFSLSFGMLSLLSTVSLAQCNIQQYTVSGGGSTCGNSRPVTISLTYASQAGVDYTLKRDGYSAGPSKSGTGYVLSWQVTSTGTYTIFGRKDGCTQQMSGSAAVSSWTTFSLSISKYGSGCSTVLVANGGTDWTWRYGGPSGNVVGSSRSINAKKGGTYYVTARNDCGYSQKASTTVGIPTISISPSGPPVNVCPGSLTLNATGGTNYQWEKPDGTTVSWSSLVVQEEGTYTLTGTNACGITETASIPVTVRDASPSAPVFTLAPTAVCPGTSTTDYNATASAGTITYSIFNAGSSTINSSSGVVSWDPEFRGVATVTATATVCTSKSSSLQVNVGNIVQYAVSGGGSTCGMSRSVPVSLTYSSQTGVSYQLELDGYAAGPEKAGTGSVLIWDVTSVGTYTIVARRGSCSLQMTGSAEVTAYAPFEPSISTSGSGCSTTLTGTGGESYAWRYGSPSGSVISSAASIYPKHGGTYYMTAWNECGTTEQVSKTVAIQGISISASGPQVNACPGSLVLSANGGSGYQWVSPGGETSGGPSLVVHEAGTYSLSGTNVCGEEETTTISVTVKAVATAPGVQDKKVPYNAPVTLTATGAAANESYNWYSTSGSLLGQGITFTTPALIANTTYYVSKYAMDGAKCESGKAPLQVTVNKVPVVTAGPDKIIELPAREATLVGSATDPDGDALTYLWTKQTGPDYSGTGENTNTLSLTGLKGGEYVFLLTVSDGYDTASEPVEVKVNFPDNNYNYIETTTVLVPGITETGQIDPLTVSQKNVSTTYYDGLGRPMQQVGWQGSPKGFDIIQPIVYDAFGRESKKYLPFAHSAKDGWYKPNEGIIAESGSYMGGAADFYATGPDNKVADDLRPYSETVFEPSPLNRPSEMYGPGQDWYDKGKSIKHEYLTNVHDAENDEALEYEEKVIAWTINEAGMPVRLTVENSSISEGYYTTGQLYVKSTINEQGKESREYSNKLGQVILKKVQLVKNSPVLNDREHWTQTYYIYDDFGNLRFVLQPELVFDVIENDSNAPSPTALDSLAFQYKFDDRNRMAEKKVPGADWVYMVYDNLDRLVLTQDGNQREKDKWSFIKYDALNRPIVNGVFTYPSQKDVTQEDMNVQFNTASFYGCGPAFDGYTNCIWPTENLEVLTVIYYDNYTFRDELPGFGLDFKYDPNQLGCKTVTTMQEEYCFPEIENQRVKGQVTGTKVKVLEEDKWIKTVNYYDKKYRPVQTVTKNQFGKKDIFSSLYDFTGKAIRTLQVHNSDTENDLKVQKDFEYDHAGRLLKTYHKVGDNAQVLLASNEYNELGELVKKNLHKEGDGTFSQSVDYRYNIRGWLTRINNSDLSPDAGDDKEDFFGMGLFYNFGFDKPQYNGNISGVRWKNKVDGVERAYGYTYDALNRLTGADYIAGGTGNWTQEADRFEAGNIQYDLNGNIKSLHRNGLFRQEPLTTWEYGITDQLAYKYKGNQLMAVNDAVATPETTRNDFKDNGSKGDHDSPEYDYDHNGNMIHDGNKGLDIDYNYLNLPKKVDFGNRKYIEYTYDASGIKLKQTVHDGEETVKETDYSGNMVYENGQLQFIQHEEGRVMMVNSEGLSDFPEYQYHLKDHLGNVRFTFSTKPEIEQAIATMEPDKEDEESAYFIDYEKATRINSDIFNHTPKTDSHYSIRLNGAEGEKIGLAKSLAVMPGDVVKASVQGKYLDPTDANYGQLIQNLITAVLINTVAPGSGGEVGATAGAGGVPFPDYPEKTGNDLGVQAYLNYLVYDKNGVLNEDLSGYKALSAGAKEDGTGKSHEELSHEFVITEPGYVYIYLSNDSPTPMDVFFDDFEVENVHSAIVQADDYYPFGLTFNSYRRENSVANKYLYNGKELQEELGLDWYDFEARMYDPVIGRTPQLDPHSDSYYDLSPYSWVANNPILFVDPDGRDISLGNLYEKDEEGNYLHKRQILAFELYVTTDEGQKWIKDRAQEGFELKGVFVKGLNIKADEAGELSGKFDATFKVGDLDNLRADGLTEYKEEDGKLKLTYTMDDSRANLFSTNSDIQEKAFSLLESVDTWAHETMLHGSEKERKFIQGQSLENTNDIEHQRSTVMGSQYYKSIGRILSTIRNRMKLKVSNDDLINKLIFHGYENKK